MARGVLLLAGLLAAPGCKDRDDEGLSPSRGELGFAIFRWNCTVTVNEFGESTCADMAFPRSIALGASFSASFDLARGVPSEVGARGLESGSPRYLEGSSGQFTAVREGRVALLALGDDSVIDYTNLYLRPVDRVAISASANQPFCDAPGCDDAVSGGGAFLLAPGVQVRVEPSAFAGGTRLYGSLQWAWTSDTPDLLGVTDEGGTAILSPNAPGTATLVVTGGGHTETISLPILEQLPQPTSSDDGSGTAADTGSDTGGDTETGTGDSETGGSGTGGSGTAGSDGSGSSGSGSSTGGGT